MFYKSVHFVGIGGIGVSALAKFYLASGARVSGSDLTSSEITEELERLGVKILIGKHKKSNLPKKLDMVIHTSATKKNNPELKYARNRRIKTKSYAEAIGDLTNKYKTITISGSHGKSTTTALSSLVLSGGYFDPMVIVGTKVKEFENSNFRPGLGTYFVLEADEWNKSFLKYSPHIAIVTNIDAEHLDTYKTFVAVKKVFEIYLKKVPKDGAIIANYDDEHLRRIVKKLDRRVIWYSLNDKEANKLRKILKLPGDHNVLNALAALKLGRLLGIHEPLILHALSEFRGTWRRFEFRGLMNNAHVFDDYAHHPEEIKATIAAARSRFPMRRIWCVYQPHQHQRLSYLWDKFVSAFDLADRICLLPVYDVAGRETQKIKSKINSQKLVHQLLRRGKNASYLTSFGVAEELLKKEVHSGDIVLIMGAGDIYHLSRDIFASL